MNVRRLCCILAVVLMTALPVAAVEGVAQDITNLYDADLVAKLQLRLGAPTMSQDGVMYADKFISVINDRAFFVQRGWDSFGNCRAWFQELTQNGEKLEAAEPDVTHECNGEPCGSCWMQVEPVIRCGCNDEGGTCNHKIILKQALQSPSTTSVSLSDLIP